MVRIAKGYRVNMKATISESIARNHIALEWIYNNCSWYEICGCSVKSVWIYSEWTSCLVRNRIWLYSDQETSKSLMASFLYKWYAPELLNNFGLRLFHWVRSQYVARNRLRPWSGNHRPGYWRNLPCDWRRKALVYCEQKTENGLWFFLVAKTQGYWFVRGDGYMLHQTDMS